MNQRTLTFLLLLALCFIATSCAVWSPSRSVVNVISPHDMTQSAMLETFVRIQLYAQAQGKLPANLADLPPRQGYANRTQDGWGNNLIYEVSATGLVTLTSLGADGKQGGAGDASDLTQSCKSVDAEGRFIAGDDNWIVSGLR